jgi:hypothetical protein
MKKAVLGFGVAGAFIVVTLTSAWAGWGCEANGPGGAWYVNWSFPSKKAAGEDAVTRCGTGCSITNCKSNINTQADAAATWHNPYSGTNCSGNGKC